MLPYNKNLKERSRDLRSTMTDAEIALWTKLRRKQLFGLQFYRQKPIGNFIVDFYCPAARFVVEIDGGQHFLQEGQRHDAARNQCLCGLGLRVLRFSNIDVLCNLDGVIAMIVQYLELHHLKKETKSP